MVDASRGRPRRAFFTRTARRGPATPSPPRHHGSFTARTRPSTALHPWTRPIQLAPEFAANVPTPVRRKRCAGRSSCRQSRSGMDGFLNDVVRFYTDLIGRTQGPMTFRLFLQPGMALLLAFR